MIENSMLREQFWPKCQECGRPCEGSLCHRCREAAREAVDFKLRLADYLRKDAVTKSINRHAKKRSGR